MGIDATLLGPGGSPTTTGTRSVAGSIQLVSFYVRSCIRWTDPFLGCSGPPTWKRLITHPLTIHERTSLITAIFSDRSEIEVVRHLCGSDAQSFIDAIDEVFLHILSSQSNPADFESNFSIPLIRY